jgi:DNA-binding transcriptional ArsR family regulator
MLRNMPFEPRELTDPMAMRALAHPVRLALLEALADAGELTATEASERVGESPSSCSFHLRQLAKYGFVEEAGGGAGRRRPWKLAHVGMTWDADPDVDPERARAASALERTLRHRYLARAEAAIESRATLPRALRRVTGMSQFLLYATPKELEALDAELVELMTRYQDRIGDVSKRPKGARAFELVALGYPVDPPPG